MAGYHGILVIGETEEGRMASITRELLGGARRVAEHGNEEVSLVLFGEKTGSLAPEAFACGADRVIVAANPVFSEFNTEAYTAFIADLCRKTNPSLCLMGQTDLGRDVAPRVAARVEGGLCMDCVEVTPDSEQWHLYQSRPVFGGKAVAMMGSDDGRTQVNTVRPKSMAPLARQPERQGEVVRVSEGPAPSSLKVKCLKREPQEKAEVNLEEAKIIVGGGGGIGGAEGLAKLRELAAVLKGAVGVTRVPVDEKWAPLSMEIGQTGKITSPDLYFAVGISGAAQHITGVQKAKCIVAVNKDPDANMFKFSDLGWVADYKIAVPALIEAFRKKLQ
ncbi:MAG TPA: electron transfer flavoprotein subunit alpha/FixB family protein [Thermodesulfobacteriota bacterium]|nr:electron transfer flavoprotein subunit alpha/FixB family protein [Thermodesulfobacteriota bacterium]